MIGPATRATIGVKLAFLEADSLLQLDAIRDLLLLLLEVLPVLRAAHLSVQTSVKLLRCPKSPKEIRPKSPLAAATGNTSNKQQHVLCHAG